MTISFEQIRAAATAIGGAVVHTPCVFSRTLSDISGARVWLKLESLQYTASFKDRGALNRLLALSPAERQRGVIAMSAGNHAQAVAYHAGRLGIAATIVMPCTTPFIKVANTERLGARIVLHGEGVAEAGARAHELAAQHGHIFIHPYDDPLIVAGQGTVALEMLADVPALDVLIVPIGGGGLIAGCAIAARALKPSIEVIGVEAALYPSMAQALRGEASLASGLTIAEGIAVKTPGRIAIEVVRRCVADILLVGEGEIEHAVHLMAEIEKTVVEGAGAVPLAALLAHRARFAGRTVGLVASGGNIDSRTLASVLMRGLMRAGRMTRLRVEVPDQPGMLATVTALIAELGGNIIEVQHERWFRDVPVRMTLIDLIVETRDAAAIEAIEHGLTARGIRARRLSNDALEGTPTAEG